MPLNQPSGQIRLTNVSVVRLRKGGKRFEIACYKNKVQEYRNRVETNLDDVLQVLNVFVNVSKGEVAKSADLQSAFSTTDIVQIVIEILKKGQLQVGEKEREHDLASLRKEIATLASESSLDPSSRRPHPVGMIEKAMAEAGFSVKPNKSAKSQVAECIKLLQTHSKLPIQRAPMRLRVVLPRADAQRLRSQIVDGAEAIEKEEQGEEEWDVVLRIDPSHFRLISQLVLKECKGKGRVETLSFAATADT